jgi:uncharacterized protein
MPTVLKSGMRIVIDTNVAISGLLWGGPPGELIDAAITGRLVLISSLALLAELDDVIRRPKFAKSLSDRGLDCETFLAGYAALVQLVDADPIAPVILRDPDDDCVLATALAGKADMIVSGDKDILAVGPSWQSIAIVTAQAAMRRI